MKTNSLIFSLVSLSLSFTVLPALAASQPEETETVTLPAYGIKAERQTAAEQVVERSLQQLRAAAAKPVTAAFADPQLTAKESNPRPDAKTPAVVAGL